jgi:two-component sensor histidine kinase
MDMHPMKLLLIDDQTGITQALKEGIEPAGHECILYQNPRKALLHFKREYFDAVITDYRMPDLDGIQLLKAIQEMRPETPVIILTGYADAQNAISAVNNGAFAFLQKPIQLQELLESLSKIEMKNQRHQLTGIQIDRLIEEKQQLSSELQIRINESFQMMCSLIRLQLSQVTGTETRKALSSLNERLRSFMMIHRQLLQLKDLSNLDLEEFIHGRLEDFFRTYRVFEKRILIKPDLHAVLVPLDQAIPWGFVINELLVNALTHAFPASFTGKKQIDVCIERNPANGIELMIRDNGVGWTGDADSQVPKTMGLFLVNRLVKDQLSGSLTTVKTRGGGLTVRVKTAA